LWAHRWSQIAQQIVVTPPTESGSRVP